MAIKKPRVSFVCGAIIFTLLFVGYFMGYHFYTEHSQKLIYLNHQNQRIIKNYSLLQSNLAKLDVAIKDLSTASRREKRDILSKIETITGEIQKWKIDYTTSINAVKRELEDLTKVDLGKISVNKKELEQKQ